MSFTVFAQAAIQFKFTRKNALHAIVHLQLLCLLDNNIQYIYFDKQQFSNNDILKRHFNICPIYLYGHSTQQSIN